mmetsp:Transcript_474/g.550  ORF Transcript_474/g.550 Transcript_474/m.550 type:complete len:198 (+) Transcript_474:47-640(+)
MEAHLRHYALPCLMAGLTVGGQLAAHPWGGSPMIAYATYAGAFVPMRFSVLSTILISLLNDIVVHFVFFPNFAIFGWSTLSVCIALTLNTLLATLTVKGRNYVIWALPTALFSSVVFFAVTNFGSWLALSYTKTWAGLMDSYTMAIPFWRNQVIFTASFTILFFGLHKLHELFASRREQKDEYVTLKTPDSSTVCEA